MQLIRSRLFQLSVGKKITYFTFGLVTSIFAAFVIFTSYSSTKLLEDETISGMKQDVKSAEDIIEVFTHAQLGSVQRFYTAFVAEFPGAFALNTSKEIDTGGTLTPVLKNSDTELNLNFEKVDQYSAKTGITATVFVKKGDGFVRIATSVKKENGERAVGTALDKKHPAHALLAAGKVYRGMATLFGKPFVTEYQPIFDATHQVVGALFVGVDISKDVELLKEKIKALKAGENGFFYVLNAKQGNDLGAVVVHPSQQGKNLLASKDENGHEYIREMLQMKSGMMRYTSMESSIGDTEFHERVAVFETNPDFQWTIVGVTLSDDIVKNVVRLRNLSAFFGVAAIVVFAMALYMLIRRVVTVPLEQARNAAKLLADGDLAARVDLRSRDELGQLGTAINGISEGLTKVVNAIREGTQNVTVSAQQIAASNMDLSARTEQQASALEETASSMEELTSTVRKNANNAQEASNQAKTASDIAATGGMEMDQVVDTMTDIANASSRISDIISVIDGIAFQTNILALNAAVEAARAGEQGRGFAVVATEVRNLAKRSADAAKEIKDLINASTEKVQVGTKQVEATGKTMDKIVLNVQRVTDLMNEISAASHEQSGGIHQVNEAISQMEQATQQNAALVEEVAAAATSMRDQATMLSELVQQFKLGKNK